LLDQLGIKAGDGDFRGGFLVANDKESSPPRSNIAFEDNLQASVTTDDNVEIPGDLKTPIIVFALTTQRVSPDQRLDDVRILVRQEFARYI